MPNTNAKKYLLASLAGVITLCLFYITIFYASLNTYTPSEWWIRDFYLYKEHRAKSFQNPKIIIVGGSSVLYGINSELVTNITDYPVVNFGTHALLPLEFHYYKIKEYMKTGDIIVLPLEFRYYADAKSTAWFFDNMVSWGKDVYFDKLGLLEKLQFIVQVSKSRVLYGLYNWNKPLPFQTLEEIQAIAVANGTDEKNEVGRGLLEFLNINGDINIAAPPMKNVLDDYTKGVRFISVKPVDRFITSYDKIRRLVASRGGTLILSWPVTLRNKKLDFSKPEHQGFALELKNSLIKRGVNIQCNPVLHNLNLKFFFNFRLHPNAQGARLHSTNLANCINQIMAGTDSTEIDFDRASQTLEGLEKQFGDGLPVLPNGYNY